MSAAQKIFLSSCIEKDIKEALHLPITLDRAGFVCTDADTIKDTLCAVQLFGPVSGHQEDELSLSQTHFNLIERAIQANPSYKNFIWLPPAVNFNHYSPQQLSFIKKIENSLTNNMILSRAESAVQFVEDIKLILEEIPKPNYKTTPTEIFIIASKADEADVQKINMMLSGVLKHVHLIIVQDSEIDYEEFVAQQLLVSKLAVIYYKKNAEWAFSFIQQIWKKIGGLSSNQTLMLLGDEEGNSRLRKIFNATNVHMHAVPLELAPLEIKIQFDKLTSPNQ